MIAYLGYAKAGQVAVLPTVPVGKVESVLDNVAYSEADKYAEEEDVPEPATVKPRKKNKGQRPKGGRKNKKNLDEEKTWEI